MTFPSRFITAGISLFPWLASSLFAPGVRAGRDIPPPPESPMGPNLFEQYVPGLHDIFEFVTRSDTIVIAFVMLIVAVWLILMAIAKAVKQPVQVSVVPFATPLESLEQVSPYIGTTTKRLTPLGFTRRLDFTVPELPHEGFFRLMSSSDDEHTVLLHEIMAEPRDSECRSIRRVNCLEFQTVFNDGTKVNTGNTPMRSPLTPLPHVSVSNHPKVLDPEALFEIHRRHVEQVGAKSGWKIRPQRLEDFSDDFSRDWRDTMRYNASLGFLREDEVGKHYQGRAMLIVRYFLPGLFGRK